MKYYPGISQAVGGDVVHRIISICGQLASTVLDDGRVVCLTFASRSEQLGAIGVHIDPHYTFMQKKTCNAKDRCRHGSFVGDLTLKPSVSVHSMRSRARLWSLYHQRT